MTLDDFLVILTEQRSKAITEQNFIQTLKEIKEQCKGTSCLICELFDFCNANSLTPSLWVIPAENKGEE